MTNIIKIDIFKNNYGYDYYIKNDENIINEISKKYWIKFSEFFSVYTIFNSYPLKSPYLKKEGKIIDLFSKNKLEEIKKDMKNSENWEIEYNLDLTKVFEKLNKMYSFYKNYIKNEEKNNKISETIYKKIKDILEKNNYKIIKNEWIANKDMEAINIWTNIRIRNWY